MNFPVTVSLRADQDTYLTDTQVDNNFSNLAAAANKVAGAIITDATTARTLGASDAWKYIRMTNAAANTITVPAGVFAAQDEIVVNQIGAGVTSFVAGDGMTINAAGLSISGRYKPALLKFISATEADLFGALE